MDYLKWCCVAGECKGFNPYAHLLLIKLKNKKTFYVFYIFLPLKQFVSALFQEEAKCFLLPYITKHYTVR